MSDEYPGRPEHPDFWLISQALLDQDAQADDGQDAEAIIGAMIDPRSLVYAAQQRAMRAGTKDPMVKILLTAAWMDGFQAGMQVQAAKSKEAGQ